MTRTITETISQEQTLSLRPETFNMRDNFRNTVNQRILNQNDRLPQLGNINDVETLDRETIMEINNTTSSERREEFMSSLLTYQNAEENRLFLVSNSSNTVREYLNNLLIRVSDNENITESDLFRISNIFLYSVINVDIDSFRGVIDNLRETMVIYNTNQTLSIPTTIIQNYTTFLTEVGIQTEQQLQERVDEFNNRVDARIMLNRRRILYAGVGMLGSLALSSIGLPPIGNLLTRSLTSLESNNNGSSDIVRLRDVYDTVLKKAFHFLNK